MLAGLASLSRDTPSSGHDFPLAITLLRHAGGKGGEDNVRLYKCDICPVIVFI